MIKSFAKYHGSENDFLIFDDWEKTFPSSDQQYIQLLCERQTGVGADGLLLLQPSRKADFRMRIFNRDGLEAKMCGNGLRCLVDFAYHQGRAHRMVEVGDRVVVCDWNQGNITVDLGAWTHSTFPSLGLDLIDTGVPHAVVFVDNFDQFSLRAPQIRKTSLFGKEGANVNFAVFKKGKFYTRTFERGIEAETRSCGSGAAAVAIAAVQKYPIENPLIIVPLSGEEIRVEVLQDGVRISGKVTCVFKGEIHADYWSSKGN